MEFPQMSTPAQIAPKFPDSIFRAYDIRGTVPEFLNAETAYWIGRAIGCTEPGPGRTQRIGRPRRSPVRPGAGGKLIQGLAESGCHVSDVGLVPTPALYYAANVLAGKSGVMLTGSHNPSNYNGFKIVIAGDTLANEQIQALHDRLKNNDLTSGKGSIKSRDPRPLHHRNRRGRQTGPSPESGGRLRQRRGRRDRPATDRSVELRSDPAVLRSRRQLPQPPPGPGQA
jgi:phosphomannomutase